MRVYKFFPRVFYLFIINWWKALLSHRHIRVLLRLSVTFSTKRERKMFNARKNPHQIIILLHETSKMPHSFTFYVRLSLKMFVRVCLCVCKWNSLKQRFFFHISRVFHVTHLHIHTEKKNERKWNGYFICAINILLNRVFPFSLLLVFCFDQLLLLK